MKNEVSGALELELAVTRGRAYIGRGVFGPGTRVSVGRSRAAALRFEDAELPREHELFHVDPSGGVCFAPDMRIEVSRGGRILTAADLLSESTDCGDGTYVLPLVSGVKGLVRFGALGFLFKVQPARDLDVFRAELPDPVCGRCGVLLKHPLIGGGARTPCTACGALTEVVGLDPEVDEDATDTISSRPELEQKAGDLPTFDGLSAPEAGDLPTFDAISIRKAGDLPTFDALSVPSDPAALDSGAEGLSVDTKPASGSPSRSTGFSGLGSNSVHTDLPTFDAISVVREQGLSTQAAISVLRGEEEVEEPTRHGPRMLVGADVSSAPPPSAALDMKDTAPELPPVSAGPAPLGPADLPNDPVEAVKEASGPATADAPVWMRSGSGERPPVRTTGEITGALPDRPEVDDLFSDSFAPLPVGTSRTRGVSLSDVESVAVARSPSTSSLPSVVGGDDFLMGRTDLDTRELPRVQESGFWLYAIGIGAGLVGIGLIAYRLLL